MQQQGELGRSPTFLVGNDKQRTLLDEFQKREQHFSEHFQRNKPLCFSGRAYQLTHPTKARQGKTDADATLVTPMLVGVADGVSQIEEFGIDPSELPRELLANCEELALDQLFPGQTSRTDAYRGPIPMMRRAFEATESLGSTTVLLAILDNSTQIHGKLHPMIAVISIGDCELLVLRRQSRQAELQAVFHTEMQRIDGHAQTPLQVARVDDRVDPEFDESLTFDVIERGSAVHCVSAYEGDVIVQGSDGVFDNLFLDEIVAICNEYLRPSAVGARGGAFQPTQPAVLELLARRIVAECHAKTMPQPGGERQNTPIGRGGKVDDTCVVVAEVVEWTREHQEIWTRARRSRYIQSWTFCGIGDYLRCDNGDGDASDEEEPIVYGNNSRNGWNDRRGW